MKTEIDYVVEQIANNGMKIIGRYSDRLQMLKENPDVNRENFIVIESEDTFARYNEVSGKKMKWEGSL